MVVFVSMEERRWRIPSRRVIEALVRRTMRAVGRARARCTLSLAFVGETSIRRLNRTWRGIDRSTDVLSFSYQCTATEVDGEIVISVPTARRQAAAIGHSLSDELLFLIVHGLLHIVGYDHERNAREKRRMSALQRRILKRTPSPV